ncbi:aldo/keto reductase [Xylanimonas cellulosilytica DSM 15894]|uniref:Aldo/keto reductase n=1 Tax=Xylanimonas cellulosilytica (strain DSM 15894 / JCM 12276 / CECT 5975 / KCTC 9989 / LMG 20990 / NBRC 107835 / XIL07) TaxID=446471 RepID=D1BX64_XYLCX|nr:aldo/keto reductase [Xylanimonas cellulosilytica]ACZ31632.1 aldo/keto reductase [Xylanimonas cellulosilytica DSM 15894]
MTAPTITLPHGLELPALGLGTWPMDDAEAAVGVRTAIEAGYRLVDTAENYRNEKGVGQGVRDAGVPREDVVITTKLNREWHSVDSVRTAWENSVRRLGVDYLDLFLIHWPNPDQGTYVQAWEGLAKLLEEGKVRAIGTSNFKPAHLDAIVAATGVVPDVNQINLNPYATRSASVAANAAHGTVTESWSPIKPHRMLAEPAITAAAQAHGVTPAQVVLRWHTQHGYVPIPKSSDPGRQAENLAVFGFTLTDAEIAAIDALDRGEEHVTDSDDFGH